MNVLNAELVVFKVILKKSELGNDTNVEGYCWKWNIGVKLVKILLVMKTLNTYSSACW